MEGQDDASMADAPPNADAPPAEDAAPKDPTVPDHGDLVEGSAAHDGVERKIDNR